MALTNFWWFCPKILFLLLLKEKNNCWWLFKNTIFSKNVMIFSFQIIKKIIFTKLYNFARVAPSLSWLKKILFYELADFPLFLCICPSHLIRSAWKSCFTRGAPLIWPWYGRKMITVTWFHNCLSWSLFCRKKLHSKMVDFINVMRLFN